MNGKNQHLQVKGRKLIIAFLVVLGSLVSADFLYAQSCNYDKNGIENPPFVWQLNRLPTQTVRQIKGKITDNNDEPVAGAVIAVFQLTKNGAKFIGSNESDSKGRFCFGDLEKGKYEIKVGKHNFQRYDIEVTLAPKNKMALKMLEFVLDVGY
jgi:hypothetical protein